MCVCACVRVCVHVCACVCVCLHGKTCAMCSLVPWLFPPPVFDHLRYAKMEREGPGDFVMIM